MTTRNPRGAAADIPSINPAAGIASDLRDNLMRRRIRAERQAESRDPLDPSDVLAADLERREHARERVLRDARLDRLRQAKEALLRVDRAHRKAVASARDAGYRDDVLRDNLVHLRDVRDEAAASALAHVRREAAALAEAHRPGRPPPPGPEALARVSAFMQRLPHLGDDQLAREVVEMARRGEREVLREVAPVLEGRAADGEPNGPIETALSAASAALRTEDVHRHDAAQRAGALLVRDLERVYRAVRSADGYAGTVARMDPYGTPTLPLVTLEEVDHHGDWDHNEALARAVAE